MLLLNLPSQDLTTPGELNWRLSAFASLSSSQALLLRISCWNSLGRSYHQTQSTCRSKPRRTGLCLAKALLTRPCLIRCMPRRSLVISWIAGGDAGVDLERHWCYGCILCLAHWVPLEGLVRQSPR